MRYSPRSPRASLRRAFTLLEILVVLAILGLLVGLTVNKFGNVLGSSNVKVAQLFVQGGVKTSLTAYRIDMGDYPSTEEGLQALITAPKGKEDHWKGPYMDVSANKLPLDPWLESYIYRYPGVKNKDSYDLYSKGPDKADGTPDDIGNW